MTVDKSASGDGGRSVNGSGNPLGRPLTAADVMKASEVADLMGQKKGTVEDWGRRGVIPSKKVGGKRLYIRPKIEALLLDDHERG
jgi:hypothetical protein